MCIRDSPRRYRRNYSERGKNRNTRPNMEKKESENFKLQKFFCENKNEEKIFNLIDKVRPVTFENLLENSDFSAFELQHILMKFELKNIIYQIEQNVYLRKI